MVTEFNLLVLRVETAIFDLPNLIEDIFTVYTLSFLQVGAEESILHPSDETSQNFSNSRYFNSFGRKGAIHVGF